MKLNQLSYICQLLERHNLRATQITITHGKSSNTLSCTIPKRQYTAAFRMCETHNIGFRPTIDTFLKPTQFRVQLTLPARTRLTLNEVAL